MRSVSPTNFAKLFEGKQALLLGKIGSNRDEYHEAMGRLYHFIHEEKPYFKIRIDPRDFFRVFVVEPQQSFERIRAQSGAFLISAFHERFERDEIRKIQRRGSGLWPLHAESSRCSQRTHPERIALVEHHERNSFPRPRRSRGGNHTTAIFSDSAEKEGD